MSFFPPKKKTTGAPLLGFKCKVGGCVDNYSEFILLGRLVTSRHAPPEEVVDLVSGASQKAML